MRKPAARTRPGFADWRGPSSQPQWRPPWRSAPGSPRDARWAAGSARPGKSQRHGDQQCRQKDQPPLLKSVVKSLQVGFNVDRAYGFAGEHDPAEADQSVPFEASGLGLRWRRNKAGIFPLANVLGEGLSVLGIDTGRRDAWFCAQGLQNIARRVGITEGNRRGAVPSQDIGQDLEVPYHRRPGSPKIENAQR